MDSTSTFLKQVIKRSGACVRVSSFVKTIRMFIWSDGAVNYGRVIYVYGSGPFTANIKRSCIPYMSYPFSLLDRRSFHVFSTISQGVEGVSEFKVTIIVGSGSLGFVPDKG